MGEKKHDDKNEVKVRILGKDYIIKGDEPADYIINISSLVNKQINKIKESNKSISRSKILVLGILNLADKLYKEERAHERYKKENNKLRDEYKKILNDFNQLNEEHRQLKEEYDEFLDLVDEGVLD